MMNFGLIFLDEMDINADFANDRFIEKDSRKSRIESQIQRRISSDTGKK